MDGIGQSLTTDRDEESILSDSYSDCIILPLLTAASCGGGISSRSSEQKPWTTEHRDKDSYRSSDKDRNRNHDGERNRSKKGDIRHGSEWPRKHSPWHAKTTTW